MTVIIAAATSQKSPARSGVSDDDRPREDTRS